MCYLAVDIGSSFIKSAILDLTEMRLFAIEKRETPPFLPSAPELRELDVGQVADALRALIERAAARYPLSGVVLSSQMHGLTLLAPSGEARTPFISWQDTRALEPLANGENGVDRVLRRVPAEAMARTGTWLNASHSVAMLMGLRERGLSGRLALLGDAVVERLLGREVAMHETNASSTGLYDLIARDWSRPMIEALSLQDIALPRVVAGREPIGEYRAGGRPIPLFAAVGDQQASILGAFPRSGELMINISTGSQLVYLEDRLNLGDYEVRPLFEGQCFRTITHLPAGRSLNVLVDFIEDIGTRLFGRRADREALWKALLAHVSRAEGGAGLRVNSYFYDQTGIPEEGSIMGIAGDNLRFDHLFYAAYEFMANNYFRMFRRMCGEGDAVRGILCAGGVVHRAPLLLNLLAERFGLPVRTAPYAEDALVGLMRLALWYSGRVETLAETERPLREGLKELETRPA